MITIPKQHYVGLRGQRADESRLPLGFATPADDAHTKTFAKRVETITNWCNTFKHYANAGEQQNLGNKIVDNIPLEGYRIADSVRRTGWNGGNVVWRIEDPRGFELEISSANFGRIVDCTTIVNGVIQGKCAWGRDGAVNVLLPENSDPYKEAFTNTVRSSTNVSIASVKPNDIVVLRDGRKMRYVGVYYFITTDYTSKYREPTVHKFGQIKKRHVFADVLETTSDAHYYLTQKGTYKAGDTYFVAISDPKVSSVVDNTGESIDTAATAEIINKQFMVGGQGVEHLAFVTHEKPKDLKVVLREITTEQYDALCFEGSSRYSRPVVLVDMGGVCYAFKSQRSDGQGYLYPVSTSKLITDMVMEEPGDDYYYGRSNSRACLPLSVLMRDGKLQQLVLSHKNNNYDIWCY